MNKDEIIMEMKKKIFLRECELDRGVKTKREATALRGRSDELNSMIDLIELLSIKKAEGLF